MAVASVTTNIVIKGQDDASAAINKASKSAKGLTGSLEAVQSKAQGLTGSLRSMVSGDVMGGLKGLSGGLGSGGGLAGSAALAAAGIAGVAVAIGAAAVKATEWSIELERLRAQMRFAFAGGEQEAFALADAIGGVGVESVVKLSTTLKAAGVDGKVTVEQMQAITNAATAMGKTGDDALSAFADAIRTGSGRALKAVGVFVDSEKAVKEYADSLGVATSGLTDAQKSQAILNATLAAVPGLAQAGTNTYAEQDKALSLLANTTTRWKLELSELASGPALRILRSVKDLTEGFDGLEETLKTLVKTAAIPLRGMASGIERLARSAVLLKRGDLGEAALAAGEALAKLGSMGLAQGVDDLAGALGKTGERQKDVGDKTKETTKAIEVQGATVGGLAVAWQIYNDTTTKGVQAQVKFADAAARATEAARKQAAAAAAARKERERQKAEAQGAEFMTGLSADQAAGMQRALELQRQEAAAIKERTAAFAEFRDRVLGAQMEAATDPATAALIEQQRIRLDLARQLAEVSEKYAMDEALRQQAVAAVTLEANNKIDASQQRLEEQSTQIAAKRTEQAFGVADAVVQGLGMIEGAERAQAGVQALIEAARSIQSFAMYDFAAGAQHALAAVAFGKAALTPAPAAPAGVGAQPQIREPAQGGASGAGSITVNVNGAGVVGTAAEVGAALAKTLGAVGGTGKAAFA
jgi:hypothetical protein